MVNPIREKNDKLARLIAQRSGGIELGCGPFRAHPEFVGIDLLDYECVDVVGEIFTVLATIPDGAVDCVHSSHFLEHLDNLDAMMREMSRVLKPGGEIIAVVPHFSNPYHYSDPTHRRFFGLYTMSYFATDRLFHRRVPNYFPDRSLELRDVKLGFRSPWKLRRALRLPFQWLFNASRWLQELYEEFFTPFVYCFELRYVLARTVNHADLQQAGGAERDVGKVLRNLPHPASVQ